MSIITQYQGHATTCEPVKWVNFPRSSYYYKPSHNRKGILPSTTTAKRDGTVVSNPEVVDEIKKIISPEFCLLWLSECNSSIKGT
jgi:hypothetical protein